MKRPVVSTLTICLALSACGQSHKIAETTVSAAASAQGTGGVIEYRPPALKGPKSDIEFASLEDVGEVKLANGKKALDLPLWSAVLVSTSDKNDICTATLIGPQVLLTAAHCVDAELPQTPANIGKPQTIGGFIRVGGPPIRLTGCEMHPAYEKAPLPNDRTPRSSEDYALCELATATDRLADSLDKGAPPTAGASLLMTGYGCTDIAVVANSFTYKSADGALRLGDEKAERVNVADTDNTPGVYLRTRAEGAEPILCPGDSGGPAYRGASYDNQSGPNRRVIGVNSKVSAVPEGARYRFYSFIAPTTQASFQQWALTWQGKNKNVRQICGFDLTPGHGNCRG